VVDQFDRWARDMYSNAWTLGLVSLWSFLVGGSPFAGRAVLSFCPASGTKYEVVFLSAHRMRGIPISKGMR